MNQDERTSLPEMASNKDHAARTGNSHHAHEQFSVRDITNKRAAGEFESERSALASLRGRPDGHFSINNHRGTWCEVEIWGGDRYIRRALMVDGSPAEFTNIDAVR